MISATPRLEDADDLVENDGLARTYREGCNPAVGGFLVDEESPGEPFAAGQRQRAEIDSQRNPQFAARRHASGSSGFELPVQTDRFVPDHHGMSVLVGEIETPLMFDVCLIPRDANSHGDRDLLRARSDHTEPATENEQLAVVHLHRISHQDDCSERWRVEHEVRLVHCLDTIGLALSTKNHP